MLALLFVGLAVLAQAKDVLFEITLTWNTSSPDGYAREAILVNDLIPGPPLYVDQGDQIYFIVWNLMPFNTTIHFHGILNLPSLVGSSPPSWPVDSCTDLFLRN
jgi:FtsP/CotA-like multicopper oxidase with cupredoxin domain